MFKGHLTDGWFRRKFSVVGAIVLAFFCMVEVFAAQDGSAVVNPVLPGFHSDPSVCKGPDGKFHLAVSSFQFFPGLPLFVSEDLVHWQSEGFVFTDPKDLPLYDTSDISGLYAPTYRYQDGQYHIIVQNKGGRPDGTCDGNLYATATTPAGPWTIRHARVPAADPSIDFIDGKWHYTAATGHEIVYGVFDPQRASLVGPAKPIWVGTGGIWPEGSHLFKRGGWYYLLIAEGGTQYGHKCVIARSRAVDGPYDGCPRNPILTHACHAAYGNVFQGVGHGDFVEDADGKWWYVFHGFRKQDAKHHLIGRETMLAPVEWGDDEWPVINGGRPISDEKVNVNDLPPVAWTHIRNPDASRYAFSGDSVRLTAATNTLYEFGSPTFVGTRQTAIRQVFSAKLLSADDGAEAGIVAYMNRPANHALVVSRRKGHRVAYLRSVLAGKVYRDPEVDIADGEQVLRVEASAKEYRFFVGDALVGSAPSRLISSETDDSFTGVFLGVFAEGRGQASFDGMQLVSPKAQARGNRTLLE